ncbi:MAG TPA: DciA family protein [Vicinamibacteria bacterium]|nr:DciA family protein [Vicinamibacteria bacterium]
MVLQRFQTGVSALRLFPEGAPRLALLRALWPQAVGCGVARRSEVLGLERDTLRVRVPDARWRRALFRMQRDIIVRLRRSAGALAPARLGFVEGPVVQSPEPAASPAPAAAAPSPALVASAEAIADPELRARFLASAAGYLGRATLGREGNA